MSAPCLALVTARYYADIAAELETGARRACEELGLAWEFVEVPGALEIPPAIARLSLQGRYAGFVALGCVIRGETSHYDIVAGESARGLMDLGVRDRLAIGNAILTTENRDQALVRAEAAGQNKGADAVRAAHALMQLSDRAEAQGQRQGVPV